MVKKRMFTTLIAAGLCLGSAAYAQAASATPATPTSPTPSAKGPAGSAGAAHLQWPMFQGGPAHTGTLASGDAPVPPYARAWKFALPAGEQVVSNPVVAGGSVLTAGSKALYAIDASAGTLQWSFPRTGGGSVIAPTAAETADGKGLVLYSQGTGSKAQVVAVSSSDHKQKWAAALSDDTRSGITVDSGVAYVGDESGKLYAITIDTGKIAWTMSLGSGSIDTPVSVSDNMLFASLRAPSTGATKIDAISPSTHKTVWSYDAFTPPSALTVSDGHLGAGFYNGQDSGRFRSLSTTGGAEQWGAFLRSSVLPLTAPAATDGKFFICDLTGAVYAFDEKSGENVWDFQFNPIRTPPFGQMNARSSPVVAGNDVVIGLGDGRLAAIDARSGHLVWQTDTGTGPLKAIALTSGTLFVSKSGKGGGLLAFRHTTGSLIDEESPTTLHAGPVAGSFALAAVVVFAIMFGLGRLLGPGSKKTDPDADQLFVVGDADDTQASDDAEDDSNGTNPGRGGD